MLIVKLHQRAGKVHSTTDETELPQVCGTCYTRRICDPTVSQARPAADEGCLTGHFGTKISGMGNYQHVVVVCEKRQIP